MALVLATYMVSAAETRKPGIAPNNRHHSGSGCDRSRDQLLRIAAVSGATGCDAQHSLPARKQLSNDASSMERIPIFKTALTMYREHPVNGVGVRAFPKRVPGIRGTRGHPYRQIRWKIRRHTRPQRGVGSDVRYRNHRIAGPACRYWFPVGAHHKRTTPIERQEAFPFALAVFLVLFPLNSHFAIYGTYTSSLIWFLVGLWGRLPCEPERGP